MLPINELRFPRELWSKKTWKKVYGKNLLDERSVETMNSNETNRKKMSLIGIYCVLVYFGSLKNGVHSTKWVDDLTKYIVEDSEFYQVKLVTRLVDNETLTNPLIEELSVKLMQRLPTVRINFGDDLVSDEFGTITSTDTSATLFLCVIESLDRLPISMTKNMIDAVAEMATYHFNSKYLVISFVRFDHDNLAELLDYAWEKKMLDFTIIELVETQGSNSSIAIERAATSPIIHQLNPFKGEYSRANSPINKNHLFPNKVSDMWGYNLAVLGSLGFDVGRVGGGALLIMSPEIRVLNALLKKLQCGVNYIQADMSISYSDVERNNADLTIDLHPFFIQGLNDTQRTATVIIDRFCPVVPILPKYESASFTELIKAYALSLGIIMIYWILLRLLRFRSYNSRMFNIGRVLFGISVTQQPRFIVERIIFTCLLLLSAVYSSTIYGAITNISFQKISVIEIKTFEDLDRLGFMSHIQKRDYVRAENLFVGPLKNLGNRITKIESPLYECFTSLFDRKEKVICFTAVSIADFFVKKSKNAKLTEPCFWNEPKSFLVGKRSPYRSRIDELIMRLQDSGIVTKPIPLNEIFRSKPEFEERVEPTSCLPQLLAISVAGYSLSIVVFIGEVIYHRIWLYIKSRKQLQPQLFPYTE